MPYVVLFQVTLSENGAPTVSLDQIVLAIALLRGLEGIDPDELSFAFSADDRWEDIDPYFWEEESVFLVPELLIAAIDYQLRSFDSQFIAEVGEAGHRVLRLSNAQLEVAEVFHENLWGECLFSPVVIEDEDEPSLYTEHWSIVNGLELEIDEYTEALLRQIVWFFYPEEWQSELCQLDEELSNAGGLEEIVILVRQHAGFMFF